MGKKLVSIIVPVYNVEKYLEKCLNSLVTQTLKDIEIIVVNDGTPDNSQSIIDKFCKRYPDKIFSFIKKNGGLSSARNFGLKKAKGQYIAFVDSDDYVDNTMFEKMYNEAKQQNYDVVVCDLRYVYDNEENNFTCSSKVESNLKSSNEIKRKMLDIYPAAWNKIYKKSLLKDIQFKEKVWFEDVEFLYRLFPRIKSIGVVKEPLYNYMQREGNITSSVDKRIYNYIDNWNGIIEFYKENNLYDEYREILEYCYVRYIYGTFIKSATKYDKVGFDDAVQVAIKNVKNKFPNYRKNKYFYKNLKGLYLLFFNKKISDIIYKKYSR